MLVKLLKTYHNNEVNVKLILAPITIGETSLSLYYDGDNLVTR